MARLARLEIAGGWYHVLNRSNKNSDNRGRNCFATEVITRERWRASFGRHRAGMTLEQIRAELGASSYAAVAMQVSRMERQLPHQRALRARLQAIAKRLDVKC